MTDTDHTSDPMGDDLDELLDAALDAAEASVADRFDAQRFDHRYGVERCEYGCAITLAEGTARELAQGMLTASLPVLLSDLRTAEARATAAEVASRGYRERAEKAERDMQLLGKIVEDQCRDIVEITRSEHLVSPDGDADWGLIWERAYEMADRAAKAEAERDALADRAEAAEAKARGMTGRRAVVSVHDVVAKHLTVEHFELQLFCGCGFRLWHPGTGFGDPSTVQQDGQTVAEAALAWHLAKKIHRPHPAALHSVAVVTNYTATGLDGLADMIHENAVAHGFWDTARPLPESIALMHSELSEALEADRAGEPAHHVKDGKPEGVAVELVDCLIRILDTLATLDVNIDVVVADKMAYNATRPRLHGKEY